MDVTAVAAAMQSLKAAVDITQSIVGLSTGQAVNAKVFELQQRMLEAQHSMFAANDERAALVERVEALKQAIARMENWEAEKQRYELKELAAGVSAYALKPAMAGMEPAHHLCPNCYEDAKKSILQGQTLQQHAGRERKSCARCGLVLDYIRRDLPEPSRRKVRSVDIG